MDRRLPPELWDLTASFCTGNDLESLCRSSKYLCTAVRHHLYQVVALRAVKQPFLDLLRPFHATLSLLANDIDITKNIRVFIYESDDQVPRPDDWIQLMIQAFANMRSIRSVHLPSPLCGSPAMQQQFFRALSKRDWSILLHFKDWKECEVPSHNSEEMAFPTICDFAGRDANYYFQYGQWTTETKHLLLQMT
jgi:hypothetical protein